LKAGSVVLKIKPPADLTYFEQYVVCVSVCLRERDRQNNTLCVRREASGGRGGAKNIGVVARDINVHVSH